MVEMLAVIRIVIYDGVCVILMLERHWKSNALLGTIWLNLPRV